MVGSLGLRSQRIVKAIGVAWGHELRPAGVYIIGLHRWLPVRVALRSGGGLRCHRDCLEFGMAQLVGKEYRNVGLPDYLLAQDTGDNSEIGYLSTFVG